MKQAIRKIFANGFYQQNGPMILFVFSTFLVYCFYINTLGTVLLKDVRQWNLAITIAVVSNPVILLVFFIATALYLFKAWQFFIMSIKLPANQFLLYSINALPVKSQLKLWFATYFRMLLPLMVYTAFACVIGAAYQYYLFPALMLVFLISGNLLLTWLSISFLSQPIKESAQGFSFRFGKRFAKPLSLLYFYEVLDKNKLVFLFTKLISVGISIAVFYMFGDEADTLRPAQAVTLVMFSANLLLVFKAYVFNERYLYFVHNLPFSRLSQFLLPVLSFVLLFAAELCWMCVAFGFYISSGLIVFLLSLLLFFRGLVYYTGNNIRSFLICFFAVFNIIFIGILYDLLWFLVPLLMGAGYLLFSKNYENRKLLD